MLIDPASLGQALTLARREAAHVPRRLRDRWVSAVPSPPGASDLENGTFTDRLDRDRRHIIPWLDRTAPLADRRILEIGCGPGASTLALAEQGARVTAVDVDEQILSSARRRLVTVGLDAEFITANAAEVDRVLPEARYGQVIFWASLEHMTLSERLSRAVRAAWSMLGPRADC